MTNIRVDRRTKRGCVAFLRKPCKNLQSYVAKAKNLLSYVAKA